MLHRRDFLCMTTFRNALLCICFLLFIGSASGDSLVPETAKTFAGISKLALPEMCGKDFWFILKKLTEDHTTGLEKEAFLKHSGYWGIGPGAASRISENGGKVPVIEIARYNEAEMKSLKSELIQNWIKEYGNAFIGMTVLEGKGRGNWNVVKEWVFNKQCMADTGLPAPTNKEEAYRLIETYFKKNLLMTEMNVPVLPGSIGFLDHHTMRWGASATTTYFGSNLLYAQLQSAFARGAVRQFGKFWHVYYANWGLCTIIDLKGDKIKGMIDGETNFSYRAPEIAGKDGGWCGYQGARFGADVETTMRPNYYFCYIAGANSLQNESDLSGFRYARYNPHASPEAPLIRNFREDKIYPSPVVDLYREVYEYSRRQPRGVPYTPFAILLDRHHGYIYPRNDKYFTFPKIEAGDYQVDAVFDLFFPFERSRYNFNLAKKAEFLKDVPAEQNCFINLPYGNIFDVLTNDCPGDVLDAYPVVLLTGLQGKWPELSARLADYVRNGGTLVMDVGQITDGMSEEMLGAEIIKGELLKGNAYVDQEKKLCKTNEYSYLRSNVKNGKAVFLDSASQLPLLIRTNYGKGCVLLCTVPHFLACDGRKLAGFYSKMLAEIAHSVMPVRVRTVTGGIDYSLNKIGDEWLATLINYDGITHNMGQPVVIDKKRTAKLVLEADGTYEAVETITRKKLNCGHRNGLTELDLSVAPGEVKIIKLSR